MPDIVTSPSLLQPSIIERLAVVAALTLSFCQRLLKSVKDVERQAS